MSLGKLDPQQVRRLLERAICSTNSNTPSSLYSIVCVAYASPEASIQPHHGEYKLYRGYDKTTKRGCPLRDTLSAVSITQIITQIEVLRTGSIPSPAAETLLSDLCFSGKHFHEVWSSMHCHPDRGSDCAHNSRCNCRNLHFREIV